MVVLASLPRLPQSIIEDLDRSDAAESRKLAYGGFRKVRALTPAIRTCGPITLAAFRAGVNHVT